MSEKKTEPDCADYCANVLYTKEEDKTAVVSFFKDSLRKYRLLPKDKKKSLLELQIHIPKIREIVNSLDPDVNVAAEQLWQYLISNTKSY